MAKAKAKPKTKSKARAKRNSIEVSPEDVQNYLRMKGQYGIYEQEVRERKMVSEAARKAGVKVSSGELQKAADGYRALMDLTKASATQNWLRKTGLSLDAFEEYLETNVLKSKFMDKLEKSSTKYQKAKAVRQVAREMAFRDWLAKAK